MPAPGRRAYTDVERVRIRNELGNRILRLHIEWSLAVVVVVALLLLWVGASWIVTGVVSVIIGLIIFAVLMFLNKDEINRIEAMTDDELDPAKDSPQKESTPRKILGGIVTLIVVVFFLGIGGNVNEYVQEHGGWKHASEVAQAVLSSAHCEPLKVEPESKIYLDANGAPDFGYRATATVKNTRDQGKIWLEMTLSTKEGNWIKRSLVDIEANATRSWWFDFPEPTLASEDGDVRAHVLCIPGGG
jgi:hypothetical protein